MATVTDENHLRENGLTNTVGIVLASSSTPNKTEVDDVPDYNEAFPQLTSSQMDINRSNTFFSSSLNEKGAMGNTTSSLYTSSKTDEDRRRKLAIHEKTVTTRIVSFFYIRLIIYGFASIELNSPGYFY
jgi:hypothetical protein